MCSNRLFVVNMAGVERGNASNEEFMEEVARYECAYHRNGKHFKNRNRQANSWEKNSTKFNSSTAEAEVKFHNVGICVWSLSEAIETRSSLTSSVEGPKFLSLQEYFANSKPMFSTVLKVTLTSPRD